MWAASRSVLTSCVPPDVVVPTVSSEVSLGSVRRAEYHASAPPMAPVASTSPRDRSVFTVATLW